MAGDESPLPPSDAGLAAPDEDVFIRLDHFLQRCGAAQTGGHAKMLIQGGEVHVNGEPEMRRRRKIRSGDVVGVGPDEWTADFA